MLLAVTGSVQAESTKDLVKDLLSHPSTGDHEVIVAATPAALQFFDRREVETLTKRPVFVEHSDHTDEFSVAHINLAEWADVIMVYPATANTIAKCAHGITDSLVCATILSARCPIFFGPSMNDVMFEHPITKRNIQILEDLGHHFLPRKLTPVTVWSLGKTVTKLHCTPTMVLAACKKLFGESRS